MNRTATTNRTARHLRTLAASTLALTAAGLTLGSLSASALPPPAPTIPIPTIAPPFTVVPVIPVLTIDPSIFVTLTMGATLTAPAGPVERGSNYAYSMKVTMGSAITGPVNLLHSIPPTITGAVWSCSATGGAFCGGPSAGSGNISRTLTMPGDSSLTFFVTGTVAADATNFSLAMSAVRAGSPLNRTANVAVNVPAAPTTTVAPPAVTTTVPPAPTTIPVVPPAPVPAPLPVPVPTPAPTTPPAPAQPIVVVIQTPATPGPVAKKAIKKLKKVAKKVSRKRVRTTRTAH